MTQPHSGASKADFTTIYDQPDPRAYFATLSPLDYQIPQQALPVVKRVLELSARAGRPRVVLDVCCSYGINAALLRYDIDLDTMGRHYADAATAASSADLLELDARFYAERAARTDLTVLGLDAAPNAVHYAVRTRLLSDGWSEDLEAHDPTPELRAGLAEVGLILCTGGVGYIGAPTFGRLVAGVADPADLWLVTFVLRVFDFEAVAAALAEHGLVTEQLAGVTFPQRRFASDEEQDGAVADVVARGLDPAGREAAGWYHADCYLTRPAADAKRLPVADALAGLGQ